MSLVEICFAAFNIVAVLDIVLVMKNLYGLKRMNTNTLRNIKIRIRTLQNSVMTGTIMPWYYRKCFIRVR